MFDIGWQELFLIAVVALIVIGPKELPRALRAVYGIVRKGRMVAREFQSGIDDMVRQADLDDIRKELDRTKAELRDSGIVDEGRRLRDSIEDPTLEEDVRKHLSVDGERPSDRSSPVNEPDDKAAARAPGSSPATDIADNSEDAAAARPSSTAADSSRAGG